MAKIKAALQSLRNALLSLFNATDGRQEELAEAGLPTQQNQYYN